MAGAILLAIGDYKKFGLIGVFKNGLSIFNAKVPLKASLAVYRPSKVFVVLGTNDRFADRKALSKRVAEIDNELRGKKCFWIGPPKIGNVSQVVEVIRDNVKYCRFVDSRDFSIELQSDKVHPTKKGAEAWLNYLLDWFLGYK